MPKPKNQTVDLKDVYPFNLAVNLLGDEHYVDMFIPGLQVALDTLSERERQVVRGRFELGLTLETVARVQNVTRERIRQIEAKALRKLRHPIRAKLYRGVTFTELIEECQKYRVLEAEYNRLQEAYTELAAQKGVPVGTINTAERAGVMMTPIEELELSIRSYNCLRRAGKNILQDLAEMTVADFQKVRNLGRKSLDEVTHKLKEYGIIIGREEETL